MYSIIKIALLLILLECSNAYLCFICKCRVADLKNTVQLVNCSSLNLDQIPASSDWQQLPNNTEVYTETILNFEYNNFVHLKQYPEAKTVVTLNLKHNRINEIADTAFINLSNLKTLDLSFNEISGEAIRPEVFRGKFDNVRYEPLGLRVLNIGHNRVNSLNPRAFEHLPDLQELYLNDNSMLAIDSATEMAFASAKSLKILTLSNTGLSSLPNPNLHNSLPALEELYLNSNAFKTVPESLAGLGLTLTKLNMNDNPLAQLDENSFLGMRNLRVLSVSGCRELRAIRPATFAQLTSLESLSVSYNLNLSYIDEDAFRELKDNWPIKQLRMHDNGFTAVPEQLLPWNALEVLDIQENPWRCDCDATWMLETIVARLVEEDPDRVIDLRCAEPESLKGLQLLTVDREEMQLESVCVKATQRPPVVRFKAVIVHPFVLTIFLMTLAVTVLAMTLLVLRRRWCVDTGHRFVRLGEEQPNFIL